MSATRNLLILAGLQAGSIISRHMASHPEEIRLRSAVPVFLVSDVNKTARWYAEHLRFDTTGLFPRTGAAAWASLQRGGAEIMLQRLPGFQKHQLYELRDGGVWDAYFRLKGVKEFYKTVAGQPFVKSALEKQSYGDWEFLVQDLNGYVLVFGGDEDVPADAK